MTASPAFVGGGADEWPPPGLRRLWGTRRLLYLARCGCGVPTGRAEALAPVRVSRAPEGGPGPEPPAAKRRPWWLQSAERPLPDGETGACAIEGIGEIWKPLQGLPAGDCAPSPRHRLGASQRRRDQSLTPNPPSSQGSRRQAKALTNTPPRRSSAAHLYPMSAAARPPPPAAGL